MVTSVCTKSEQERPQPEVPFEAWTSTPGRTTLPLTLPIHLHSGLRPSFLDISARAAPSPPEGPSSHSPSVTSYSSFLDRKSHPSSQSHQCLPLCGPLQLPKLPRSQHAGIVTPLYPLQGPAPPPGQGLGLMPPPRCPAPGSLPALSRLHLTEAGPSGGCSREAPLPGPSHKKPEAGEGRSR